MQSFVAAAAESVGCSAVAAAAVVLVEAVEAVEIRGRQELDALRVDHRCLKSGRSNKCQSR